MIMVSMTSAGGTRRAASEDGPAGLRSRIWNIAATVRDPELPMLTLADLGILRDVELTGSSASVVITPTYSGCPALVTMRADLLHRLAEHGFGDVRITVRLDPPWTTDWISEHGSAELRRAGISAPGPRSAGSAAGRNPAGVIPVRLGPTRRMLSCPRCGCDDVALVSEFGSTACQAHYRCRNCREPFEHIKEI
jgi:ring-1,2-phenylacetyl-CoA epoxidase subunit PaaD